MKRIILVLLCFTVFVQGCSKNDEDYGFFGQKNKNLNLPKASEEYGKAVAKEIRSVVLSLNRMGVDYSKKKDSPTFKSDFFDDVYQSSSSIVKTKSSKSQFMANAEFAKRSSNLSGIQIEYIIKITDEVNKCNSIEELERVISNLNKDIYKKVPQIEQERLFNVTSGLYYGSKEIQRLEEEGQMFVLTGKTYQLPRLKSGNEEGGGLGDACRRILASTLPLALAEPTFAGEVIVSIALVYVTAQWLYERITCPATSSGGADYHTICMPYNIACLNKNDTLPGSQKMNCRDCYDNCVINYGQWDTRCNINGWL